MSEQVELPKDGKSWWKKLLGIDIKPTAGEIKNNMANGSSPQNLLASQEAKDAQRLIEIGNRTKNPEALKIGKKTT
jgi:hypothetical protein